MPPTPAAPTSLLKNCARKKTKLRSLQALWNGPTPRSVSHLLAAEKNSPSRFMPGLNRRRSVVKSKLQSIWSLSRANCFWTKPLLRSRVGAPLWPCHQARKLSLRNVCYRGRPRCHPNIRSGPDQAELETASYWPVKLCSASCSTVLAGIWHLMDPNWTQIFEVNRRFYFLTSADVPERFQGGKFVRWRPYRKTASPSPADDTVGAQEPKLFMQLASSRELVETHKNRVPIIGMDQFLVREKLLVQTVAQFGHRGGTVTADPARTPDPAQKSTSSNSCSLLFPCKAPSDWKRGGKLERTHS